MNNCCAQGMVYSIYGPIMVDMKYILQTSMKWISLFSTFETSGYILGTFGTNEFISKLNTKTLYFILGTSCFTIQVPKPTAIICYILHITDHRIGSHTPIPIPMGAIYGFGLILIYY